MLDVWAHNILLGSKETQRERARIGGEKSVVVVVLACTAAYLSNNNKHNSAVSNIFEVYPS